MHYVSHRTQKGRERERERARRETESVRESEGADNHCGSLAPTRVVMCVKKGPAECLLLSRCHSLLCSTPLTEGSEAVFALYTQNTTLGKEKLTMNVWCFHPSILPSPLPPSHLPPSLHPSIPSSLPPLSLPSSPLPPSIHPYQFG